LKYALVGVVLGWRALRQRPNRTLPNLALVGSSVFGLFAQAFVIQFLFFGV